MNILIVEDEPNYSDTLEMFLDELGYQVAGVADEGTKAIDLFDKTKPDLVLMDINLKGQLTGIDIARHFQSVRPTPIIFITSYDDKETFNEAKSTAPYAYLIKPFDPETLERSMELALQKVYLPEERVFDNNEVALATNCFFIKERNRLVKVNTTEILWVSVEDKYCQLHTKKRNFLVRQSLTDLATKLDPSVFVQTHRSYIVNAAKIDDIDIALYVVRIGDHEIPLGKSYKDDLIRRVQML